MCANAELQSDTSAPCTTIDVLEYPISDTDVSHQGPVLVPASVQILTYGIGDVNEYSNSDVPPEWHEYFSPALIELENRIFWMEGNVTSIIQQVTTLGYNVTVDGVVTLRDGGRWQIGVGDITGFIELRKV
jgi:hypothetical protein